MGNRDEGASPLSNSERQRQSRERRARAYMIVKALAQRRGFMQHPADTAGLDRFLDAFEIHGHEVDWLEAVGNLG